MELPRTRGQMGGQGTQENPKGRQSAPGYLYVSPLAVWAAGLDRSGDGQNQPWVLKPKGYRAVYEYPVQKCLNEKGVLEPQLGRSGVVGENEAHPIEWDVHYRWLWQACQAAFEEFQSAP
jgi:hypothetical protein